MEVIHSWLKEYLGKALPEAKQIEDLLTFHAFEIEGVEERVGETIIDVDVLPNRSSDSLSHRGVAREVATLLDVQLETDPLTQDITIGTGSKVTLHIEDKELCPRFTAAVITGVKVKESPTWLKQKLEALGQRSINNVVDATNYVMYGIGQPTHAFDFDKMGKDTEGRVNITVRLGKAGEELTLLTGEHITSDPNMLHLVDGNTDTLLDLAGIKGGAAAELTKDTMNIVVTSGNFNFKSVRQTARKVRITTDASNRFQNQPSPELAGYGLQETVRLILELAGGENDGMVDAYPLRPETVVTKVRVEKVNDLLGLSLSVEEVKHIIERIGATVEEKGGGVLVATAPWERTDLVIEADYIEEVGRIHGLSNIEPVVPEAAPLIEVNKRQYYSEKVRHTLMAVGFSEVITSSFLKKAEIQLQNALAGDKSYIRNTLLRNITAVLDANIVHCDLLGIPDVRVFEIGAVFDKTESGVGEHLALTLGARTKGNGYNPKDDQVLEVGQKAVESVLGEKLDWKIEKGVAELDLGAVLETLLVPTGYEPYEKPAVVSFRPIVPYPAIARDIALWVAGDDEASEVADILTAAAGPLLVRHDLFDTFEKDDRTSYAFRLVFQSPEKTLTDEEVNKIMDEVYAVAKKEGWEVR